MQNKSLKFIWMLTVCFLCVLMLQPAAAQKKPNILIIWGDDIGWFNISAYNDGMMGYKTPNIDRIMNEGIRFTDAYGHWSFRFRFEGELSGFGKAAIGVVDLDAFAVLYYHIYAEFMLLSATAKCLL